MKIRIARRIALGLYLANIVCLIWPAVLPFNRIRPFVLGLPFSMFWMALWLVIGLVVLVWLDRMETRAERRAEAESSKDPVRLTAPPRHTVDTPGDG